MATNDTRDTRDTHIEMQNLDVDSEFKNTTKSLPEYRIETVVTTEARNQGIRNKLSLEIRDREIFYISGWKACAFETLIFSLSLAGAFAVGYHGTDVVKSLKNRFF
jgi:hypothetical protein